MVSDFFYMPSNQKVDEETRIAYTQSRIADVRGLLNEIVFQTTFTPRIPDIERDEFFAQFNDNDFTPEWKAAWIDNKAVIERNWWVKKTEEFCQQHRCKIPDTDFLYILMLMFRDKGIYVRPADCSLTFSYKRPDYLFSYLYDEG